jgi:acetoin utilization deacetylase AcuC-like enzyme
VLAVRVQAMATPLLEAEAVILAAPDMPPPVVRDAASALARLHDVAAWWAAWQFEPRELATLGAVAWADWVMPRMNAGTIEAAALRVGVALAVDEIARTDEEDAAGLHRLHADMAELAGAVPPNLWPSFAAGGEHDTALVAPVGHG